MIISEKIFELLKERGMNQKEFALATGISQSTISDWKTKGTNPAADKIMVICDVLGVTPVELLTSGKQFKSYQPETQDSIVLSSEVRTLGDQNAEADEREQCRQNAERKRLIHS